MVLQRAPMNAFTVDLEEWFQGLTSTNPLVERWPSFESRVVPATERLLALLRAHQVQATFFVLGYVADRHPALIERIAAAGHEIAIHGYFHRFVSRLTAAEFEDETGRAIAAVARITGEQPWGHRAPYFSMNGNTLWALDVLRAQGIRYDSSFFPTRNMLYGYPGAPRFPHRVGGADGIMEFPASTVRWGGLDWPIAGGFYLRSLPVAFVRWGIARLNAQGQPAILYLHPWELDTEQPRGRATPREQLTHFHGRAGLERKLRYLFDHVQFRPLRELMAQVDGRAVAA